MLVLAMWALLLFFGQREIRRIDTMQERQAQIRSGYAERAEIAEINKRMQLGFDRLSDQIAEINRYLRNKGGG